MWCDEISDRISEEAQSFFGDYYREPGKVQGAPPVSGAHSTAVLLPHHRD